jgi:hypothetical protein
LKKKENPILILDGSKHPFLSIGVRCGGVKFNGSEYSYHPIWDMFVRQDYVKQLKKYKDKQKFIDFIQQQP